MRKKERKGKEKKRIAEQGILGSTFEACRFYLFFQESSPGMTL